MKKIAVLIDGGHVRVLAAKANKKFTVDFVEKLGHSCALSGKEDIQRVLYYDAALFAGTTWLPISGTKKLWDNTDSERWLHELAHRDLFAVRRGVLRFRGYTPRTIPIGPGKPLTDADFKPNFEQKGVDIRIGLDMANYAANRSIDLLALVTNDTDCIPAMKYARRAGLQVALVCVPLCSPSPELVSHCDFKRDITWP
jgi:uncharacterized LabA/DUF88 family protein